jgi:diguanylate cyclase (GGDEF)-like protein
MATEGARRSSADAPDSHVPPRGGTNGRGLHARLRELQRHLDCASERLDAELHGLEQAFGDRVYSELIYLLSHLRFDASEARTHWRGILGHRDSMQERMGSFVDLRVALASYFLQVQPRLENPKIIELRMFEEATASAYRDELTGLYNYRFFEECLRREILAGERCSLPVSLVMIDIDNFKTFNDRNGHPAGNKALAGVGGLLSMALRKLDAPIRYGGEEFAMVLPATTKVNAKRLAERIRKSVASYPFRSGTAGDHESLTVSLGVATFPADARDVEGLVCCADKALYHAKAAGKNRVQLYGQSSRSYQRIDDALAGEFRVVSERGHRMTTVKVSEGGLMFIAERALPSGTLIDLTLRLPGGDRDVVAAGRVVSTEPSSDGTFEIAVQLTELGGEARGLLGRFVRDRIACGDDDGLAVV